MVVVATTKVRIFKQITTQTQDYQKTSELLLLPQRYVFSSKSQPFECLKDARACCCCYHKGTYFQANHNRLTAPMPSLPLLLLPQRYVFSSKSQRSHLPLIKRGSCCCYHKGTYFQANHNFVKLRNLKMSVVVATTKVRIFKQITTHLHRMYRMSCCCCYHKGTYFQANHNTSSSNVSNELLLLLPQRYVFSSKSQLALL